MTDTLRKYYKAKKHRKVIQSLASLFHHQDLSQRLIAHSYLVYYAKLCAAPNNKSSIPYCYRLFLIYQTLISVLCDNSEDVRRICIKALFVWIVACNNDIIIKDFKNNPFTLQQIAPMILSMVGISDTCDKNRVVVFNQLNQLLLDSKQAFISIQSWIQMFYKKPIQLLDVESITEHIPLYYTPILNNGKFLFLHTSFAPDYKHLLHKIDHMFNENTVSAPYLYVHIDALKRSSCGLFSHVLDDEIRECRVSALNTMKYFVKYVLNQITASSNSKCIEIEVNVARDADIIDANDSSDSKMDVDGHNVHDHDLKCKILSRTLSFIADLLNDESVKVRSMTLVLIKELMIFGSDTLKIGDDFLPLIQIMTGDYTQKTRIGAYQTLQYLHLSRPQSLFSLIKSLNSSIVRYPNDKKALVYALSILSYRHSRLLEPILNSLIDHKEIWSLDNLKHLSVAVIIYYGCLSNKYLAESISSSIFQYISECKRKYPLMFEYKMDENMDKTLHTVMENSQLMLLHESMLDFFVWKAEKNKFDLRLLNTIIRMLHNVDINKTMHRIHPFLCLSSILRDVFQFMELNICSQFISSKLIALEHHTVVLYQLCRKFNKLALCKLVLCLCFSLYLMTCHHFGKNKTKMNEMNSDKWMIHIELQFTNLQKDTKQYVKKQIDDLITGKVSLWQALQQIFNIKNYMECFKEYNEMIYALNNSSDSYHYESNIMRDIISLKTEQNNIYFHPLAPIEIPLQCVILSQYARFITPKLRIKINGNLVLNYYLCSTKRWNKDLQHSNFLKFKIKIPNLTPSTNFNPCKNYGADITIEMVSDHTNCVLFKLLNESLKNIDIIPSNTLSVSISVGLT